jgi:hypothetical protein
LENKSEILFAGGAHAVIAYELHLFTGWTWRGLMVLDCALLFVVARLFMAEGRARERVDRGLRG